MRAVFLNMECFGSETDRMINFVSSFQGCFEKLFVLRCLHTDTQRKVHLSIIVTRVSSHY